MIDYGLIDPNVGEKPPETRVQDAGSARSMLYTLIDDDQIASYRRSQIQGIIDGNSPYNDQQLREMGQGDRINVNWGHAESKVEAAVIPYFDILTSVANYATIKTQYGTDMGKREEWSRIISEEFHRLLARTNPGFLAQHQIAHKQLVIHGQACMYWPDGTDFKAKAIDPWSLVVPKGAGVDQDDWEFCYVLDEMYCEELYRYIKNPEAAKRGGWNVEECQQAIMDARVDEQDQRRPWEWYQKELKLNALYYSYAKSKIIKVAHMFVKEYDGRVSHYVFDRLNGTEFLCEMPSRYKKFSNAFTVYLNGVGNGYYHGVRGLGQKVYKWAEAINRVNNALMEGVIVGSAVMFQPNSAADAEKMKTVQIGPYRILPPGLQLTQVNVGSNLSSAMQVASMFQGQEADEIGSFLPTVSGGGGRKKGNKEVEIEIGEKSRLTNTRAEIYLQALDIHYREVYRRASNPNILAEDQGGNEAIAFQDACLNRGVPAGALLDIESVKATRSIGQGSSAARMQAMELISEYLPQLPESNRKRVINANIAAIAGQTGVETFGIPEESKPDGSDLSISSLENNAFQSGGQVIIDPDQNHFVHLTVHLQFAGSLVEGIQDQKADPRMVATVMQSAIPHILTHLKYLEEDPTRQDQFENLNEQTSELMKIADQINAMAKQMQDQEMAQQQQQAGQSPQDPKTLVAMNKIQLDRMKLQNDMAIKSAKAQHQMQLQDKKTSQRLMVDRLKVAAKYGGIQP
jgi:hypothetical protein